MTVQTDFMERCKALNLHDGKLSDWLDEIESLRQQLAAALAACKLKDAALKELRRAIGDHYAPHDCYATGPVTGNDYRDIVECPACSASAHYDEAITIQPDDAALKAWLGEPVARLIPVALPDGHRALWARTFDEYSQESSENNAYRNGPEIPLYSPKVLP